MDTPGPWSPPIQWQAVLRPHRSLPPGGFLALMLCVAGASFAAGILFVRIGAWPVGGFFGLDVALLYLALRLNYRDAGSREVLRLQGSELVVERIGRRGETRHWRMPAFWLRVELIEARDGGNRLIVTTHGHSLPIGGFLSPGERRDLARELDGALKRWKALPG
jgi:uncharacterized membrane protein